MRRIRLVVAYDGTEYHGWQLQRNGAETIEGQLLTALRHILPGELPMLTGASRTDAGVHSMGNVAVFDTESRIPADRFAAALNSQLPEDIQVLLSEEVPESFHPRFTGHKKHYVYRIDNAVFPHPLERRQRYHCPYRLDTEAMKLGAAALEGEHDFRSFVNPDAQVFEHGGDAVRKIDRIKIQVYPETALWNDFLCGSVSAEDSLRNALSGESVHPEALLSKENEERNSGALPEGKGRNPEAILCGSSENAAAQNNRETIVKRAERRQGGVKRAEGRQYIDIHVIGNGFLYHQIRIMAGTLLKIGMGQLAPEEIPKILAACDRRAAGPTLPAKGLCLVELRYNINL